MEEDIGKKGWRRGWTPLRKKEATPAASAMWKSLCKAFSWKRLKIRLSFFRLDNLLFKAASVVEAVVLVSALCFFYLFCGCKF
ncbi:hypothetical protein MLD38_027616 [Melastoma candidum]|uniref:Uncharacterized protein n=1 Tax=Melastoma candidum TaxID=119954 RepID=A0ACB9P3V3_9MYRT|nr:hypothetical protein MLD38_027616 [Melastoma candidum]